MRIDIKNIIYNELLEEDILICAMGYEQRSTYIYSRNEHTRNSHNTLVFQSSSTECTKSIESKEIDVDDCGYEEVERCQNRILQFCNANLDAKKEVSIYIDYSFMPRSWYCSLPKFLCENLSNPFKLFFIYTAGDYPSGPPDYPSAGIDSFTVFSGISLPAVDIKRYHIMGLGYDCKRTETVKAIVEPDLLIACYAYNPQNPGIKSNVYKMNKDTIDNALLSMALPLNNFSGMCDKLRNLVYEQLSKNSQIILIPDGPKPLIMAMSLVPDIIGLPGVTCLHISHNQSHYSKAEVLPRKDEIYGFQFSIIN